MKCVENEIEKGKETKKKIREINKSRKKRKKSNQSEYNNRNNGIYIHSHSFKEEKRKGRRRGKQGKTIVR